MARKLVVEIVGDSSQLERTFAKTGRDAKKFETQVSGIGRSFAKSFVAVSGASLGLDAVGRALSSAVSAASDLNEQTSKSRTVFGQNAAAVEAWSRTTAAAFGLSQRQALATAASFGAIFTPLGMVGDEAATQSRKLTELGADFASFYNTDVQSALDAIRSGIIGEAEPLRRYGVLLSEARVQAEAMAETGKTVASSLTAQEKVAARIALIFKDSAVAQGDFAKTSDGLANQGRILTAQIDDLQAALGQALLPHLTEVAQQANAWLSDMDNRQRVVEDFTVAVDTLATAFGVLAKGIETSISVGTGLKSLWDSVPGPLKFIAEHTGPGGAFTYTKALLGLVSGGGGGGSTAGTIGGSTGFGSFVTGYGQAVLGAAQGLSGAFVQPGVTTPTATATAATAATNASASSDAARAKAIRDAAAKRQQLAKAMRDAAAATRRAAAEAKAAGWQRQLGWLQLGVTRADATKTLADDRAAYRALETALVNKIRSEGRTVELVSQLVGARQALASKLSAAAEAAKAAASERRRAQAAERQRQTELRMGWLEFAAERAEATKSTKDDLRAYRAIEAALRQRIAHEGRTLDLARQLWQTRQKIHDLTKTDPLAGLVQVSSRRMAAALGAGLGLDAARRGRLQANIAAQEIHNYVYLDGQQVASSVNRHNARSGQRTGAQTSGRRG